MPCAGLVENEKRLVVFPKFGKRRLFWARPARFGDLRDAHLEETAPALRMGPLFPQRHRRKITPVRTRRQRAMTLRTSPPAYPRRPEYTSFASPHAGPPTANGR